MDINDIRSLVTLAGLMLFLALVAWTWWPARRDAHDAAAQLPFAGENSDPSADEHGGSVRRDNGEMQ